MASHSVIFVDEGVSARGWEFIAELTRDRAAERLGVETLGALMLNDETGGLGESGRKGGTRPELHVHGGIKTANREESTRR